MPPKPRRSESDSNHRRNRQPGPAPQEAAESVQCPIYSALAVNHITWHLNREPLCQCSSSVRRRIYPCNQPVLGDPDPQRRNRCSSTANCPRATTQKQAFELSTTTRCLVPQRRRKSSEERPSRRARTRAEGLSTAPFWKWRTIGI